MQPASISSRFAAMNLDMIIFGALWQALSIGIEKTAPEFATPGILLGLCFIVSILYFVYPTKASGQTIGKKLLNLKVVPKGQPKGTVSWGQAILREVVGKWVSSIPFFLGYIWAYFHPDRRTWHDSMGGTEVLSLVWEEEKTTAQKVQQIFLAIISIPAGVALITVAFLYTSLPLDSIKEKIEASGIQVGELSGSLAGGLRFENISRNDAGQKFNVSSLDVKFNLWALLTDNVFYIEKITAEEGHIEVPADFSLMVIFANLLAVAQFQDSGTNVRNLTMAKFHLKNIYFEHNKKVLSHLQEFSVKNLAVADKELYVNEMNFQIVGFLVKAVDVRSSFGRVEIGKATGGVTPEFLPMLKAPVDFHVNGTIAKNPKNTKIEAGLVIDKIKINYAAEKLTAQVDQLTLNEMFKMSVPVDELNMKLTSQGTTVMDMLSTLQVEYGVKVCGQEFKPDAEKGPSLARADRQFNFRMMPLPVLDFGQVVFAKEATLDDLFGYELHGTKQIAPAFASTQEMISDLCFQKPVASLQPTEVESLKPLEKVVQSGKSGGSLATMLAAAAGKKAEPVVAEEPTKEETPPATAPVAAVPAASPAVVAATSPTPTPTPGTSPTPEVAKVPTTPAELMKTVVSEAKNLMKQGKFAEAKVLLEAAPVITEGVTPAELGSFYNMKAWVYLYSSNPEQAAQNFESAFNARKDIGDAEGLLRSYEALKKDQDAQKWWDYIKSAVKANPGLKNQLTPNMQRKLASEVSAESPQ
ncbi:RDD family protein [Bdellovibrio sp. HCB337]|uniref:RDD family protein n=1 Tax=Bdellovibrio sp. HCB337 TaxID=3394358 RepID=UPI0039A734E0